MVIIVESIYIEYDGSDNSDLAYRRLWGAVINVAVMDLFTARSTESLEAYNFIFGAGASQWFNQVCDMAGTNAEYVRRKVEEGIELRDGMKERAAFLRSQKNRSLW